MVTIQKYKLLCLTEQNFDALKGLYKKKKTLLGQTNVRFEGRA